MSGFVVKERRLHSLPVTHAACQPPGREAVRIAARCGKNLCKAATTCCSMQKHGRQYELLTWCCGWMHVTNLNGKVSVHHKPVLDLLRNAYC